MAKLGYMTMFESKKLRNKGILGIFAALMIMGIFAFKLFFPDPDEKINRELAEGAKLINKLILTPTPNRSFPEPSIRLSIQGCRFRLPPWHL